MTENKRAVDRTPVPVAIVGHVTVLQPMTILDLSEAGAQIETPYKLQKIPFTISASPSGTVR